jgi:hypothetical protein
MSMPTNKTDDLINKSLEEIDAIVGQYGSELSKAVGDEDISPEDVAEGAGEEEATEEDTAGDDGDVDNDEEAEQNEQEDEEVEKSLEDDLKSDESVRKALEVSEFLSSLVKGISSDLLVHKDSIAKSLEASEQSNELLAKSFAGIAKSQRVVLETQAELLKSVRILNKRIKTLESQPQVRKSVSTAQEATTVIEKSFNGVGAPAGSTLSKSQISAKLFKGFQEGQVEQGDLFAFESLGTLGAISANAQAYVNSK